MATQPERLTKEFRGRTETEIEIKFTAWQQQTAGQVRAINKLPIKDLPMSFQPIKPGYQASGPAPDAFSMLVEYEAVPVENENPKRR
jgi:hypothetical protein